MKKDKLVLGKGPTQGLEHISSAEKMYSINFFLCQIINFGYVCITLEQIDISL